MLFIGPHMETLQLMNSALMAMYMYQVPFLPYFQLEQVQMHPSKFWWCWWTVSCSLSCSRCKSNVACQPLGWSGTRQWCLGNYCGYMLQRRSTPPWLTSCSNSKIWLHARVPHLTDGSVPICPLHHTSFTSASLEAFLGCNHTQVSGFGIW